MVSRRKDNKGHVLHDGESQRKDGTYMFRYFALDHKRKCVYAKDLDGLRKKEELILKDLRDGIDSDAAKMTVIELVEKYYEIRSGKLKHNSKRAYSTAINRIRKSSFGAVPIGKIRKSDAQAWFIALHNAGLKRNTLSGMKTLLYPAFEMAVEDDMIRKNPFKFNLNDMFPDDAQQRTAIPEAEQKQYLDFIREHSSGTWIYEITILLETGMRVSELYGLTLADIDFAKKRITVNKQLCRTADKPYFIETPKSKSGNRTIPMSEKACFALTKAIAARNNPTVEPSVDGVSGFLFLDIFKRPKVAGHLDNFICRMRPKYIAQYGEDVTFISPHVFRHTFSSNMNEGGMNPKNLQTLMGHSRIEETYDTYTHTDYNALAKDFRKAAGEE